ncbi:MAG: GWxTD domain-containing protein [Prolixibacteraceae bacterium]|nr:GWxTD domain-containing protein [Prolixibacteraceae bacterium]
MKVKNCYIYILRLLFFSFLMFFLVNDALPKKLSAFLTYATFNSPGQGPYIETYLSVNGKTIQYVKNESGKYQGTVQVILLFKNGEDIVNYDKYEVKSPELADTLDLNFNFLDQQRYSLPNGNYDFEIQIWDLNSENKPFINLQPLVMNYPDDEVIISGIQLIDSYQTAKEHGKITKSGYDLIPMVSYYFPESVNKIIFYSEVYNTKKVLGENEKYLISCYLQTLEKDKPLGNYIIYKKQSASDVNVIFSEFDITNLQSGNYYLVVEARDKQNQLLHQNKLFIQRSNPRIQLKLEDIAAVSIDNTFAGKITDRDTMIDYIRCLEPISTEMEKGFALVHLQSSDVPTLQKYFYNFWHERNPADPEKAWQTYLSEVNKVNLAYSTQIQKGFDTDRGRIYLKYGPPNAISESYNEPATYPYEIWHYYELTNGQRNKRFIFYTKDIVTNDFMLLHSDVTGELSNYRWQYALYQRVDPGFDIDQGPLPDSWGGNSKKYFDLPR